MCQPALSDDVDWIPQPAFEKAFADLTGGEPPDNEWQRVTNWNFTGDDGSYAQ